jgi:large conductance mechanosensitive channel
MKKGNPRVKKFVHEFQKFAFKDSTFGTAVGIMIGVALKDVIDSLINNILMPPIAYITSGIDFSDLFFVIGRTQYDSLELAQEAGALVVTYGSFINAFINFFITALVLFFLARVIVKNIQKMNKKEETTTKKVTKECPYCKSKIHKDATRCPNCTSKL